MRSHRTKFPTFTDNRGFGSALRIRASVVRLCRKNRFQGPGRYLRKLKPSLRTKNNKQFAVQ